ncbi:3-sulfolactaldehyde reductase [Pseudomonas asiatica]|nr:3-sulfolactaldehyde reductase [Pseudomonas asiatica]
MFIQLLVALFIMFNCEQSHVGIFTHPYGKQVVQFYTPSCVSHSSAWATWVHPKAGHQLNLFDLNKAVLAGIRPGTPTVDCSTIDPQTARDVSKAAAAKGVDMGDAPASRGYTGGFGAELMLKDLGLATEAARQAHQPVILGAVAQQLYQAMSLRGEGGKDFSAIVEGYRKKD